MGNKLHYFINSNSCEGFTSFFRSNFGRLRHTIHLEDYPAEYLADLLGRILKRADEANQRVEVIHNCLDNTIEGLILPDCASGIVNLPAYIDCGYHVSKLIEDRAVRETKEHLLESHRCFAQAKEIHDDWERFYRSHINYAALNRFSRPIIDRLLGDRTGGERGISVHRFLGAATENGPVDHIEALTASLPKRCFIQGRPGTGKSTFLKKLSRQALSRGFDVELYHCAFDPASYDMVIVRDLGVAVFDSTMPHEKFPSRDGDEILDFYEAAVDPGIEEMNKDELDSLQSAYKQKVEEARLEIAAANEIRLERESLLQKELDSEKTEAAARRILAKILGIN